MSHLCYERRTYSLLKEETRGRREKSRSEEAEINARRSEEDL